MRTSMIRFEEKKRSSMENRKQVTTFPVLSASSSDQPQVKETDDEDHTLTASVFGNHLVLKEIFKHLPVADLLECSLVDSFWKSNARTVLRENKRCLVRIRRYSSCVDLKNFVDMLPRFHKNEIPFNGMSIRTPSNYGNSVLHENDCIQCDDDDPSKFAESLLSVITIRHLKLGWDDHHYDSRPKFKCPTVSIIKKIVAGSASTLEWLQFVFVDHRALSYPMSLLKYFLGTDIDLSGNKLTTLFPKLKFFKTPRNLHRIFWNKTAELLDVAPRIKNLMGEIEPKHTEYLLKFRKVDILKQFIFKPGGIVCTRVSGRYDTDYDATDRQLNRDLQLSLQLAMEQPKLKKLTVKTKLVKRINPDDCARTLTQIKEICHRLFKSSFKSLHSLCISHLDLLVLQRSGRIVPTKVKQLTIYYIMFEPNQHKYTRLISMDLEGIQFSKIFPYLEGVKLYGTKQDFRNIDRNIIYLERACVPRMRTFVTLNDDQNSCTSVSKLKLKSWILYDWYERPGNRKVRLLGCEKEQELLAHDVTKDEEIMKSMQDIYRTIFPNVTEFTYQHDPWRDLKGTCKYFWTTWNNLERIKIYGVRHVDALENLDSDFLGMAEEQCCLLRESDDCLNFFWQNQVGTSIRNLTKLKLIRIEIRHNNRVECCKGNSSENGETTEKSNTDPDLVFLSAAAATCTIAQMPKLTLEFVRQTCKPKNSKCHLTCHHLSPFVKLLDAVDIVRERLEDELIPPNEY